MVAVMHLLDYRNKFWVISRRFCFQSTEQTTLNVGQNSRFNINCKCKRRLLSYDSGAQLRINNGRWLIAELMASPLKKLEGVSRDINISQIIEGNNIKVEGQMFTTEYR
ncbi:MAG: hypothetical protein EZS28_006774 [Streblomastix strix]|uniref:Uncharacterized protein n=1 Tax=Streblomastix strix TaxID=222440 RepID=A0A5J4WT39_9EUKA|nr:MAG: hypothetical protein EZS28_006774 [Streblomastix strix]